MRGIKKRLILGFHDNEKMDGISNVALPFIVTDVIANYYVSRVLLDDRSSCNLICLDIFAKLDLKQQNLKPCKEESILAFNDSFTRLCEQICLPGILGERSKKMIGSIHFRNQTSELSI